MIDPQSPELGSITDTVDVAVRHMAQQGGAPWVEHMSPRVYKRRKVLYRWPDVLRGAPRVRPGGWWVTLSLLRRPRGYAVLTVEAAWRERDTSDRLWWQPWRWIRVMRTTDETITLTVIDQLELIIWRGW